MKRIIICLFTLATVHTYAQDAGVQALKTQSQQAIVKDPTDTATKTWKKGGMFSLNMNQGSLSNWSAGGDKFSFSVNALLNAYAFYKHGIHSWDNNLDLAYGMINTTSLGNRKASDMINFTSKYGR